MSTIKINIGNSRSPLFLLNSLVVIFTILSTSPYFQGNSGVRKCHLTFLSSKNLPQNQEENVYALSLMCVTKERELATFTLKLGN